MKISKHFSRSEVACKCGCGFDTMDAETLKLADEIRDFVGVPIRCNCGARCQKHNDSIDGSVKNSQHVRGRAMDLKLSPGDIDKVLEYIAERYPNQYGIGKYNSFIHIDTKSGIKRRW